MLKNCIFLLFIFFHSLHACKKLHATSDLTITIESVEKDGSYTHDGISYTVKNAVIDGHRTITTTGYGNTKFKLNIDLNNADAYTYRRIAWYEMSSNEGYFTDSGGVQMMIRKKFNDMFMITGTNRGSHPGTPAMWDEADQWLQRKQTGCGIEDWPMSTVERELQFMILVETGEIDDETEEPRSIIESKACYAKQVISISGGVTTSTFTIFEEDKPLHHPYVEGRSIRQVYIPTDAEFAPILEKKSYMWAKKGVTPFMQGYEYCENGEHTCVQSEAVNSNTGERDEDIFLNKYRDDTILLRSSPFP